jgi:beta-phosphoglucomutase-like phosphatase (HAD superfamily)
MRAERAFSSRRATSGAALCPGARQFIENAAGATRLAVVTRARRGDADTMLRLSSLGDAFTTVVTADDLIDAKPSGEGHRLAIERLSKRRTTTARQSIALENGVAGIRAARDATVRCVAIGPLGAHVAMEANAYVPSLEGVTMRALETLIRAGEGEGLPQ